MPIAVPASETRGPAELEADYRLERQLADRLRGASRERRQDLYGEVYDLFHLQVSAPSSAHRESAVHLEYGLVSGFLEVDSSFLEIGAGDAALAKRVAAEARSVHILEASEEAMSGEDLPENCHALICDATHIELPPDSVQVAYSCHFIEHLHPEDAAVHARSLLEVLAPGGVSICVTPNRLWGPHDISRYFADEPQGFHLREYDHADLADLFSAAGFERVAALRGFGTKVSSSSLLPYRILRRLLAPWSPVHRRSILGLLSSGRAAPFRRFEQVVVAAWKAGD